LRDALLGLLAQASGGESAPIDLSGVANTLVTPQGFDNAWRIVQFIENQDITYAGHDDAARVGSMLDQPPVLVRQQPIAGRSVASAGRDGHTRAV
jgi:1,4-alpha-glucan branching enzyme